MKTSISFSTIFRKPGRGSEHSVERDWLTVLAGFVFVIILVVAHAAYFYHRVENGALYGAGTVSEDEDVSIDTKRLDHVAALIDEREKWPETIMSEVAHIVDPSQ
ncbi:MAG: hypothetical protein G01um101448_506 [Parcubacteria group bacterium Gr01-1014_48]|nr:MAG: hypothetical protein Greene041614_825 [Parcubacteria group bacterium Greene0416_14]TSC73863.1 MAG: hypothetical protein G01um101448_506 [Parcubacteria group bacterium Gr01-1014_48]TSD00416.1 MAG: hypothetical protein Greene101415_874 [Parcubacteria group bacterium Greene1014_15]TSD07519.1 MAG: hypothetical protein Greene07144_861 [Parcubacteria group bacterium Greene0714_4]